MLLVSLNRSFCVALKYKQGLNDGLLRDLAVSIVDWWKSGKPAPSRNGNGSMAMPSTYVKMHGIQHAQ